MLPELNDYDWAAAFAYAGEPNGYGSPDVILAAPWLDEGRVEPAPFTREDVQRVIYMQAGENDAADWLGVFELKDGRFATLSAGCDYTGWDCQAGGRARVASTLDILVRFGLTDGERDRLGIAHPTEAI